jgi:hypothetical protein
MNLKDYHARKDVPRKEARPPESRAGGQHYDPTEVRPPTKDEYACAWANGRDTALQQASGMTKAEVKEALVTTEEWLATHNTEGLLSIEDELLIASFIGLKHGYQDQISSNEQPETRGFLSKFFG